MSMTDLGFRIEPLEVRTSVSGIDALVQPPLYVIHDPRIYLGFTATQAADNYHVSLWKFARDMEQVAARANHMEGRLNQEIAALKKEVEGVRDALFPLAWLRAIPGDDWTPMEWDGPDAPPREITDEQIAAARAIIRREK